MKGLVEGGLKRGAGFVVTVGEEPLPLGSGNLSLTYDWTILETAQENAEVIRKIWPAQQGSPIVCVGFANWSNRIPASRRNLWQKIVASGVAQLQVVKGGMNVGGSLRTMQAKSGDILVTLGGGPGVEHLAEVYAMSHKHVIALDLPLKIGRTSASERIAADTQEHPERYFDYRPPQNASAAFSLLSLKNEIRVDQFERRFYQFLARLSLPQAFFVRLMDREDLNFRKVESYFRKVVDPVIRASGYTRFEMNIETTGEPFLNSEIFHEIDRSSLVVSDLTGLRNNCFTELGFALGAGKKVVVMAEKGTSLPFDTHALPCNFWSANRPVLTLRKELVSFMAKNINRRRPGE